MKEHEQAMNEEKIQFLVNISHELRTPLTLIYAPLKRLIDTSHENLNPEVIHGQLNTIYKQSRKMKNLINMVLDLNRIKTEQKSLQKQPHPLNKWIVSVSEISKLN
ncbi:MAG: sensor histidine kinase [Parabacteroides sp.]